MGLTISQLRPRVLLNDTLLALARKRAASTHAAEFNSLLCLARSGGEDPGPGKDYHDPAWRLAFLALLSRDAAHIAAAVRAIEHLLACPISGQYFAGARRLKALACAYDWLHDSLGEELRYRIATTALAYCQALYDSGEIEPNNFFLGHNINQIPFVLMAGIAVGSDIAASDPQAPKVCEHPKCDRPGDAPGVRYVTDVMRRLDKTLPCYRHFLEQDCFQQSYSYTCTYVAELPYLFQVADVGLGTRLFEENESFRNVVKWWTYAFRSDETFHRFGDYFCSMPVLENPAYYRPFATIAARYRDPLAQWWVNRFRLKGAEPDQILFEERADAVVPRGPESLSRTAYFAPMGVAVARGDFADGTVAAFKCTPIYLHNHGHRDANSFVIYHRGDLAIDSGAYDSYETPQWYNYYVRTIAHNTVVVHDPDERMISRGKQYANDGGQRFINEPHFQVRTYEDIFDPVFKDGEFKHYLEGPGFAYACGDASNCYRKNKLARFFRHVLFVLDWPTKSAVSMVVLDELSMGGAGFIPRYLLHTMDQPEVTGSRIVACHNGGRLTTDVLLPRRASIEVIGGPGKEFLVDGKNYALDRQMAGPHTPGAWRAEVSDPCDRSLERNFLTLLVPNDTSKPEEPHACVVTDAQGWVIRQGGLLVDLYVSRPRTIEGANRTIRVRLAR